MGVFLIFTSFLLIFITVDFYLLLAGPGLTTLVAFYVVFFLNPANSFLAGSRTFCFVELYDEYPFIPVMQIKEKLDKQVMMTFEEYFEARESIDARDHRAPINWLLTAAVWSTVICIVLLFAITQEISLDTSSVTFCLF